MKQTIYNYCYALFFICACFGCEEKNEENNAVKVIDIQSSVTANISDLFQEFKWVQLETNDSCFVGLFIEKIECYKDKIFLLNAHQSHSNILCFDMDGNFLFKIDRLGNGPGEYTYLGDFFIDKTQECIVLQTLGNEFMQFDLEGNFIKKVRANDEYNTRQVLYLNDSILIACVDPISFPYGYSLLELDRKTFNIRNKSSHIKLLFNTGRSILHTFNNQTLYYSTKDTIYDISNFNQEKPIYYIDCGQKQKQFKKSLQNIPQEKMPKALSAAFNEKNLVYISYIFNNTSWITLSFLKCKNKNNAIYEFALYDKKKEQTYVSEYINFDILNLPSLSNLALIGNDNDRLFIVMDQEFSKDEIAKIKKSKYLNEKEKRMLSERNFSDNPVLLILK